VYEGVLISAKFPLRFYFNLVEKIMMWC